MLLVIGMFLSIVSLDWSGSLFFSTTLAGESYLESIEIFDAFDLCCAIDTEEVDLVNDNFMGDLVYSFMGETFYTI